LFSFLPLLLLLLSSAARRRVRGKEDDLEGKAAQEEEVVREDKEDCMWGFAEGRKAREGGREGGCKYECV